MFNRFAVSLVVALCLGEFVNAQPPATIPPRSQSALPLVEPAPADKAPPVFLDNGGGNGLDDHWWVSADYLFGWVRASKLPPLVTTSLAGTPRAEAGVLGEPG